MGGTVWIFAAIMCLLGALIGKKYISGDGAVLSLSVEDNEVGYLVGNDRNYGAESFTVCDGVVYVLDTMRQRVICKSRDNTLYYSLSELSYAKDILAYGSRFYIFDSYNGVGKVFIMDKEFNTETVIPFPEKINADEFDRFYVTSEGKPALNKKGGHYALVIEDTDMRLIASGIATERKNETTLTVRYGEHRWDIEGDMDSMAEFQAYDSGYLYCILIKLNVDADNGYLSGEVSAGKVSDENKVTGLEQLDMNENSTRPNRFFGVYEGKAYTMYQDNKKLIIKELFTGQD